MTIHPPDFSFELRLGARGVAGVDEAGRGPLAGPVTAAAVILDPERIPEGLDDSKRLPRTRREALYLEIGATALVAVGHASVREIEEINILRASHVAMERAIAGLGRAARHILVDGNMLPRGLGSDRGLSAQPVVGGDARCLSIAAASIVAKVVRDRLMAEFAEDHPGYGWATNAGYGTPEHLLALRRLGITRQHRRSFAPVHNILCEDSAITD